VSPFRTNNLQVKRRLDDGQLVKPVVKQLRALRPHQQRARGCLVHDGPAGSCDRPLKLSDDEFGDGAERMAAYEVEDHLIDAISPSLGEVDGHEFGGGFATIFVYGPSADAMAALILPIVSAANVRA
jgi:hypothetical protein